jgi:DNA repair protein RadA/Sms
VLYVSGEESIQQLRLRADRLGIEAGSLFVVAETTVEEIINHISRLRPAAVVIDSIQTVTSSLLDSAIGSVSQVKDCANSLVRLAKTTGIPVLLVGHVTKEGAIAGPKVLEHMVDTVLYLEGDLNQQYRLLRAVKNRYGSTNEVGVFEMGATGFTEVQNPSESFLSERLKGSSGSAVAVTLQGSRPILLEVQALTSTTNFNLPRRVSNGIDFSRLLMLVAVLTKRVGLQLSAQDVYVNIVGGIRIAEPAIDLAVVTAIASSLRDVPVLDGVALIGEVGLAGELRSVQQLDRRLQEAKKLGYTRCVYPRSHRRTSPVCELEAVPVATVREALRVALQV